jgi:hypothetical protein
MNKLDVVLIASPAVAQHPTMSDPHYDVLFSDPRSVNGDRKLCERGGEIHVVHRSQFDATHKLVKSTDSQHSGKVPASAYK